MFEVNIKIKLFSVVTRCVCYQKQSIQHTAGGNSHTGWVRLINLEMVGMQRGISQHALLHGHIISCFTLTYLIKKKRSERSETGLAAGRYLEPVSGTPQKTPHSRSSRTLRLHSGADTRPHFRARGGRREGTGIRSDTDLLTGRRGISPGTEARRHGALSGTNNPQMKTAPHPLRARVHTLVHRHVLDDGAERKGQRHVVRPAEATFEDGAAV